MKVFFATLSTETNTFSSIPTSSAAFASSQSRGADVFDDQLYFGPSARLLRTLVEERNGELIPSLFAFAQPGAPVIQTVYEQLRDSLLGDLKAAAPVDLVLLILHGAMMAQDIWDCEGDILRRVRDIVGKSTPVGAVLDPHAHLTQEMVNAATVLVFQKEYPHTDLLDRLKDAWRICCEARDGRIDPTPAVTDCKIVSVWPTTQQPTRGFVDRMMDLEAGGEAMTISFVHGFSYGDSPVTGAKMLVYADGDRARAKALADRLSQEVWEMRAEAQIPVTPLDAALDRIIPGMGAPIILADMADNPGGGAPSDATFVLRAVLDRGLTNVGFAIFFDPVSVAWCHDVGVGAKLALRIGGKLGPASGLPVDLEVEVMGLAKDAKQHVFGAGNAPLGDAAWVRGQGVDIVLSSERTQCYDPSAFSCLGLVPTTLDAIVVKSTNHFRAGFDRIARAIVYLESPGALTSDFAAIPFKIFKAPYWPRVARP